MLDIEFTINLDGIIDDIDDLFRRQIPWVANSALNESVFKGSTDLKKALPYFIQGGAVPFTKRGVQYLKSKDKMHPYAEIFIPDAQWKYMQWVIDAGVKRFNRSREGGSKPIYSNVKFNKYGNIPGRRRKEAQWRKNFGKPVDQQTGLGKNQFIGTVRGVTGLWKRVRNRVELLVLFDFKPVNYGTRGRFPFRKFAIKYVSKHFKRSFNKKLQQLVIRESRRLNVN
jgi:hypothetical protein